MSFIEQLDTYHPGLVVHSIAYSEMSRNRRYMLLCSVTFGPPSFDGRHSTTQAYGWFYILLHTSRSLRISFVSSLTLYVLSCTFQIPFCFFMILLVDIAAQVFCPTGRMCYKAPRMSASGLWIRLCWQERELCFTWVCFIRFTSQHAGRCIKRRSSRLAIAAVQNGGSKTAASNWCCPSFLLSSFLDTHYSR